MEHIVLLLNATYQIYMYYYHIDMYISALYVWPNVDDLFNQKDMNL